MRDGLYDDPLSVRHTGPEQQASTQATTRWRIAPQPFMLSPEDLRFFETLGTHLLAFYRGVNRLYLDSARGTQPAWVAAYFDQGKPDSLVAAGRLTPWKEHLPAVIRPDIIPTDDGPNRHRMVMTELDSVPGGIGLTGALGRAYGTMGDALQVTRDANTATTHHPSPVTCHPFKIVGGPDGMIRGFAAMLRHLQGDRRGAIAVVVSEEAKDYRPEMTWLASRLREQERLDVVCLEPQDVRFAEEGLSWRDEEGERQIALLYRFFELFDLPNVPKAELILYSAKQGRVAVTPPFKPALEEKLAFALLHHPSLAPFWREELGEDTFGLLAGLMPRTWTLDPSPVPPAAVIPELRVGEKAVADWRDLASASQKGRRFVVKPSGFSELAWGSRGVSVGHDLPQSEWAAVLDQALASFATTPYVLQEFHKGRQFHLTYEDRNQGDVVPMAGRARLSPYYFVVGDRAELGGILATVCPLDKKVIHGMRDAIMIPCAVAPRESESHKV